MHAGERGRGLLRFVRLQMADQVPSQRSVGRLGDLLQGFLDAIFAEVTLTRLGGFEDGCERKRLGDGNEGDAGGIPPGSLRGGSNPGLDEGELVGDGHRTAYFLIDVRMPLACSAY